jgi:hypothetical protein
VGKSSVDYTELAGLRIALANLQVFPKPNTQVIIDWMKHRITELEEK